MIPGQFLASHWRSFVSIAGALFTVFALTIIVLFPGRLVLIRSSIDIGSHLGRGDTLPTAFYPAEQLAKRTTDVYIPQTLSEMSKERASVTVLKALQSSSVENAGLSIVITTAVDASAEDAARKFQESLAALILDGEKPRAEALGEAASARATATSFDYEKQISTDRERIERIDKRMAEIENDRLDQEAELARLLQRQQSAGQADEQVSLQTRIQQLQERIANQATALTTLVIQQSSFMLALKDAEQHAKSQRDAAIESQLAKKLFSSPRVSLPPTPMLITSQWRRAGLLAVALVVSLLIAFGAVISISNIQTGNRHS